MQVILVHGMGRTPVSMMGLRRRLARMGHTVHLFGYVPSFQTLDAVTERLAARVRARAGAEPYLLVGHSLGSVIIRNALSRLEAHPPRACFFLAPPMVACRAAKFFSRFWLYRAITGEMGVFLGREAGMEGLPLHPETRIYAGTAGPRGSWSPFRGEVNDGILSLAEAKGDGRATVVEVPAFHTYIMNAKAVAEDLGRCLEKLVTC